MGKKTNYKITKPKYLSFSSIIFVILIVGIFIMLRKFECFHGDMLFWFFASTSQSMAALFAVGGVFAVFRFQAQEAKLRNLCDIYKKWIMENSRYRFFHNDPETWKDDQLVRLGRIAVKEQHKRFAQAKKNRGGEGSGMATDEKEIDSIAKENR